MWNTERLEKSTKLIIKSLGRHKNNMEIEFEINRKLEHQWILRWKLEGNNNNVVYKWVEYKCIIYLIMVTVIIANTMVVFRNKDESKCNTFEWRNKHWMKIKVPSPSILNEIRPRMYTHKITQIWINW